MTDLTAYNKMPQYIHFGQSDHMETPIEVQVEGEIPKWINGCLYRNGAGVYKIGPTAWNHLFDGYAVLQRWTFNEGKVTFQHSILDTGEYKKSANHRKLVGDGIGSSFPDPCETIFGRLFNRFRPSRPAPPDNTNVSMTEVGDRLVALTESVAVNEVNPETLTVKEKSLISDYIAVHLGTAHPHKLKDGTSIFFGTNMNHKKAYNFIAIPPQTDPSKPLFANAKVIATVPSRWKLNISYSHTFGKTENYFLHLEQPLAINVPRAVFSRQLGMDKGDIIKSFKGESLDILLVSRATGQRLPITYKAPEGFVLHFVNCYEESDHIVCDMCFFEKGAEAIKRIYFDLMLKDKEAGVDTEFHYSRFVLPLSLDEAEEGKNLVMLPDTKATAFLEKGSKNVVCVTPEVFGKDIISDVPGMNYDYNGVKHRYAYTSSNISPLQHKLAKYDMLKKTVKVFEAGANHFPSEPVFLARPGAIDEDDGVIMSTLIAANSSVQSYVVVLDAATFTEVARANLPPGMKMSFTFHGLFTDKKF